MSEHHVRASVCFRKQREEEEALFVSQTDVWFCLISEPFYSSAAVTSFVVGHGREQLLSVSVDVIVKNKEKNRTERNFDKVLKFIF